MKFPLEDCRRVFAQMTIPSRERGRIKMETLYGTAEYLLAEMAAGLEQGVHDFVVLKGGRQIAGSTTADGLALFWPQTFPGMTGMYVSDDDDNRDYRRDVVVQMLDDLPRAYRWPTRLNNRLMLAWDAPNNSRLLFASAGRREGKNLGRSRGINFLIADEVASWVDQRAIIALRASFAKTYPHRLALWISTARGFGPFKEMWDTAQGAVSQRAIFVPCWRHEAYRITPAQAELWARFGDPALDSEERHWRHEVMRRWGAALSAEFFAWYRWILAEECYGDEAMRAQEYGLLPEECFQAFGDRFFPTPTLQHYRGALPARPPSALRFEWSGDLDRSDVKPCAPSDARREGAHALIFAEPDPQGLYVIGARPARSSDPESPWSVLQVCRAYPDRLEQVAEYASDTDAVFQFAWAIVYFAGAYRMIGHTWLLVEMSGTGRAVLQLLHEYQRRGYGFSAALRSRGDLMDVRGSFQHYVFRRPDNYQAKGSTTMHWEDTPKYGPWLWNGLRDEMERRTVGIASPALLDEMARIRRGEEGHSDIIGGGGRQEEGRAYAMALATECWTRFAVYDARIAVAPKAPDPKAATTVEQRLVQDFLAGLDTGPAMVRAR